MKYKITFIGLFLLIASSGASAQIRSDEDFGLGLILGEPTGLSLKYWFDEERAVDGALAWSLSDDDAFQMHADYLFHDYDLSNSNEWPVYYGVGALLSFKHDEGKHHDDHKTVFGFRFPIGMSYLFENNEPFELFFEIA
ncbi:MAG: DUF3996 domain-containing protein, partial [Sedimentisphaerales bacterium]